MLHCREHRLLRASVLLTLARNRMENKEQGEVGEMGISRNFSVKIWGLNIPFSKRFWVIEEKSPSFRADGQPRFG